MTYSNGYVGASALVTVQGSIQLETSTAAAYQRMKAAATAAGVSFGIATPVGGYRSYAVQVDMSAHPGNYGLNPNSGVALASPGHSSHGFGTRVDISPGNDWALSNASTYGFFREFGSNDPNHYAYQGPTVVAQEDEEVSTIRLANVAAGNGNGQGWIMLNLADGTYWGVPNMTQVSYLQNIGVPFDTALQAPAIYENFTRLR